MMKSIFDRNLDEEMNNFIQENKENFKFLDGGMIIPIGFLNPELSKKMRKIQEMKDFQRDIIFLDEIIKKKYDISYLFFKSIFSDFFDRYYDNDYIYDDYIRMKEELENEENKIDSYEKYIEYLFFEFYENDYDYINLRMIF